MSSNSVQGLAETYSMLGRLPDAAKEQLGVEMARIGYEVLAAQKRDAPKATGFGASQLSLSIDIEALRLRVGLFGSKYRKGLDAYYLRFHEFGRRAQTVLVTRHLKRRVTGNGRTSKRRVIYEGTPYKMRVRAMAKRPFIHVDRPEIRIEQRLANFWSIVTENARSGA